jgi:hypothetical protein
MCTYKRLILPYGMMGEVEKAVGISRPTLIKALKGNIVADNRKAFAARRLTELKLRELEGH